MHGDQLVPMGAVGRLPRWFTHSYCSRSPKDAAGCEQPQAFGSISMDCVEELAQTKRGARFLNWTPFVGPRDVGFKV